MAHRSDHAVARVPGLMAQASGLYFGAVSSRAPIPDWIQPMAATLTQDRFVGDAWTFEQKHDGIRLMVFKNGRDVRMYSRTRRPQDLPRIRDAIAQLSVDQIILDGELTWDRETAFHVFDVLWLDGRDLTPLPLSERRQILDGIVLRPPLHR